MTTPRQMEWLWAIRNGEHRSGPKIRDLAAAMGGSSTNGVADMLKRLEAQGLVQRDRTGRTYVTTKRARELLGVK